MGMPTGVRRLVPAAPLAVVLATLLLTLLPPPGAAPSAQAPSWIRAAVERACALPSLTASGEHEHKAALPAAPPGQVSRMGHPNPDAGTGLEPQPAVFTSRAAAARQALEATSAVVVGSLSPPPRRSPRASPSSPRDPPASLPL